jgi:hypothetical protein
MKQERNFSEDVKINKYHLEEECEKHAGLYFYWAEKLALARNELNAAEDKMKLTMAELDQAVRRDWDDSNQGKMTETGVKAKVDMHHDSLAAKKAIQEAQSAVNILQAAESAMNHRKSELDNLVTLLVKGFYAAPNGGKREGPNESAEREIRTGLKKRKENA